MVLNKDFLHPYSDFPALSRSRLITGIILGLLFAFSFYAFLYLSREALRLLFFHSDSDLLVFTDRQVYTYNLFFAYIATIIGQSLCVVFWLDTPIGKYGKYRFKVRAIINDQRNFNSYFLSWFSRMGYTIAMIFGGLLLFRAYSVEDTYPFNMVLILIILVLFLHSWINLRRLFLGKALRWMLYSAGLLSVLSWGLSRINFIDYKEINRIALQRNVWHHYHINLTESDKYDRLSSYGRRRGTIMVVREKTDMAEPVLLFNHTGDRNISSVDFHRIVPDSLYTWIKEGDENLDETYRYQPFVIYIDKDISMQYINKLKNRLSEADVWGVEYAVMPVVREYNPRYYDYLGLPNLIPPYYGNHDILKEVEKRALQATFRIDLKKQREGTIMLNDSLVNKSDLRKLFIELIKQHPDYFIRYYIEEQSTYAHYIGIISDVLLAVESLRNEYSILTYKKEYSDLEHNEYLQVREEIPVMLWEITEDMEEYYKH